MFPLSTLVLVVVVLVATLYFHFSKHQYWRRNQASTLVVSIGVLGTFIGIAMGIMAFDTQNIQQSVPLLLAGLKTAFWSSIVGMASALTMKFRYLLSPQLEDNLNLQLCDELQKLRQDLALYQQSNQQQLQTSSDSLKAIRQDFAIFLNQAVDANVEALSAAIETVLKEFNVRINEQYGGNFKRLNSAVGKMMEWQQNHQQILGQNIQQLQTATQAMDKASILFSSLVSNSEGFEKVSESLGKMLQALSTQSGVLESQLSSLSGLVGNASTGLPQLESRIDQLTQNLAKSISQQNLAVTSLLESTAKEFASTLNGVSSTISGEMLSNQQQFSEQISQAVARNEQQLGDLDQALERELTRALCSFGNQMTALSEKFVSDYTPLTDRLRELVRVSEAVEE